MSYEHYQLRVQMAEMDRKAIEETHIEEATAKGRAEGRAEVARNLLQMGVELDKIAQATQLSLDEIKGLMAGEGSAD